MKSSFRTDQRKTLKTSGVKRGLDVFSHVARRPRDFLFAFILIVLCATAFAFSARAQNAPGAPGDDAQWASAAKTGIGTSATTESKIWLTLERGALTEVFYPHLQVPNVHVLQFVVVDPGSRKVETEREDAVQKIVPTNPNSLSFRQINTAKSGEWQITKTYATNPASAEILIDVSFTAKNPALALYVYYDPSLNNSGMHDTAWTEGEALLAQDGDVSSALLFSGSVAEQTNGFLGRSDGLEQLRAAGKILTPYARAEKGNVVQMAKILRPKRFSVILAFAENPHTAVSNARAARTKGFARVLAAYEKGWADYVRKIRRVAPRYERQFKMAAMVLKAHEDKIYRGANVGSLTSPWGSFPNANEPGGMGYHLVWGRDSYHSMTGYMALGDRAAAERALDFLFRVQQREDGSFPQASWFDGRAGWGQIQMDEVAYPLIVAYQLGKTDAETYRKHIKRTADYIVRAGPKTLQERWEEEAGYSPSTIAAEIAGLVCAAEIALKNGDRSSADLYLKTADEWVKNLENWTVTKTGKYGDGNYYLRLTQNGKPDAGDKLELQNGAGTYDEREIVDTGFLELVRLGIKPADDPLIVKTLVIADDLLKVETPNGESWHRYTFDGYGETYDGKPWNWDGTYRGNGHLWTLLTGERGQYEIALLARIQNPKSKIQNPKSRLDALMKFANDGLMIPEQIWSRREVPKNISPLVPELKFGEGTGTGTPIAWTMAQFIRLAVNLQEGRNLDTPEAVARRYGNWNGQRNSISRARFRGGLAR